MLYILLWFQGDDSVVACLSNGKVAISYNPEKNNRRIVDELIVGYLFFRFSAVVFKQGETVMLLLTLKLMCIMARRAEGGGLFRTRAIHSFLQLARSIEKPTNLM